MVTIRVNIVAVQEHWLHDYKADQKVNSLGDVSCTIVCYDTYDKILLTHKLPMSERGTTIIRHNHLLLDNIKISQIESIPDRSSRTTQFKKKISFHQEN